MSTPPANITLRDLGDTTHVAISPDGARVVYTIGPPPSLLLRPVDDLGYWPIQGTDNGLSPFFSPDGRWIGFMTREELRKVSVTGGAIGRRGWDPRSAHDSGSSRR